MLTEGDVELVLTTYGNGMEMGANHVLDLIEDGVPVEVIRERAMRRIARTREDYKAALEAGERFDALQQQGSR